MITPRLYELAARRSELFQATRRHPDPRVRHRAHVLLRLIDTGSMGRTCAAMECGNRNLGKWKQRFLDQGMEGLMDEQRFLDQGMEGLMDEQRSGRRRRLSPEDDAWLADVVLYTTPMERGYVAAIWSLPLLCDLVRVERGVELKTEAMSRNLKRLGLRYSRARHDLHHLQNADAVESCRITLQQLQKKGVPLTIDSSMLMKRMSTPTQAWQKSGSA